MFKAILISGLVALSAAQSSVLTFTHVPNPITDGQQQAITYSTNDTTSPVTIILRKGASGNLQTVQTLTSDATGGQYVWTPAKSLPNGDDYALEITQGTQLNYFGPFVVQGASASASISSTVVPSSSVTVSSNGTASTTVPLGTGMASGMVGTASGASGTGVPMSRNTTMSMATLTASSTAGSPTSNTAGATTTGAGSTGSSSTSSAPASTASSGASQIASSAALVLGAVAAVFYLQ